jgi:uncharacterized protein YecE (DUF72 family)
VDHPPIFLGTSSFTAAGWEGSFYPKGMRAADYLSFYAEHFQTVEVDATFYGCPSARTVKNWAARTPDGFLFSVKVPQVITHEKVLADCDAEFAEFVETMDLLGPKLGPIVLQFPFFDRWTFPTQDHFFAVLAPFLKKLSTNRKFAIEIRNKTWLDANLANLLREHRIALVLQDLLRMPGPAELSKKFDPITTDWTYIRWLGDRKGIEEKTQTWDKAIVDRRKDLTNWVEIFKEFVARDIKIFAYANNHYAGHAPATIKHFRNLWHGRGLSELAKPHRLRQQSSLFDLAER